LIIVVVNYFRCTVLRTVLLGLGLMTTEYVSVPSKHDTRGWQQWYACCCLPFIACLTNDHSSTFC